MKHIYLFAFALFATLSSRAQTVPNSGMETWRTSSSAGTTIHAPTSWFGYDSLVIAMGPFIAPTGDFKAQLFQETVLKNSGTSSAKLISLVQDSATIGVFPGTLSSAKVDVDIAAILGGADPLTALTFTGGVPTTLRTRTVSAYVAYFPGKDTGTHLMGGPDTATLTVQAVSSQLGFDSVIGVGYVAIPPSATFTQITANVTYADTSLTTDKVRIIFFSSGGAANNLDSSTLYVDDVTMTGTPQAPGAVASVNAGNDIQVYPNPAIGKLFINAPQDRELSYTLLSMGGQLVANGAVNGQTSIDLSAIAQGMYYYTISDTDGVVKTGKVTVTK